MLRQIMSSNASWERLKETWIQRFRAGVMRSDPLREASDYGIVTRFDGTEIAAHAGTNVGLRLRWLTWTDDYEMVRADPDLWEAAGRAFFDDAMIFPRRTFWHGETVGVLETLTQLLNVHVLTEVFSSDTEGVPLHAFVGRLYGFRSTDLNRQKEETEGQDDWVTRFTRDLVERFQTDVSDWRTRLAPWAELVDRVFGVAPRSPLARRLALLATAVAPGTERGMWTDARFSSAPGLAQRLYFARLKQGDANWWSGQLRTVVKEDLPICLSVLMAWGDPDVLGQLRREVSTRLEELSAAEWELVLTSCNNISRAATSRVRQIGPEWFGKPPAPGPRMALVMIGRLEERAERRRWAATLFSNYQGGDGLVLQGVAAEELVWGQTEEPNWELVYHLSKRARKDEVEVLWSVSGSDILKVPKEIATRVLEECEEHCGQLVAICERSYGMGIAGEANKVSTVAERDRWFATHPV